MVLEGKQQRSDAYFGVRIGCGRETRVKVEGV